MKSEIYFSSSAPNPMSTTMKLIHFEKIDFDETVGIKSQKLELVPWCQKIFYTDKPISLCTVNINIPYVGNTGNYNDNTWNSTKIVLFLDDEPIYTGQFNSHTGNLFRPLLISADKPYLKEGTHNISLKACVAREGHMLAIPFVDKNNIDYTVEPKNFATIKIIGFY